MALVREEGLAWFHQLRNEVELAIPHRKQEIQLIERFHESVRQSVSDGGYDENMAKSILRGRDLACLQERRAILKTLVEEEGGGAE
jgi:hypothetical protein